MTNIFATPEKVQYAKRLFEIGIEYLEGQGYKVSRVPRSGKKSLRRVKKGKEEFNVAIRTSQDQWFAFPRDAAGNWLGMDDVDVKRVIVVALNTRDEGEEKIGLVHDFSADEVRKRLNKNFDARFAVNPNFDTSHGNWISLYTEEAKEPTSLVGAGIGLKFPPVARIALLGEAADEVDEEDLAEADDAALPASGGSSGGDEIPLTIAEAKRRLAITFGVDPTAIKITVEG
ncbi:hypothetical protein HW571_29055 [Agrobacterium genomosp. 3]|uniref:Uncharacterized protein n=1 Tax=Brucella rhizosphaerae TaxID=571254 RepID=A0A256FXA2_9HYPH|nr:hypothetical protein [Brucella rhizosphaerae]MCA1869656.1 hypothetical protein [Agrobacterium tomkonis]MCA1880000.1 hypothetical protein [Agrobacterium tumefaciens]MCA1895243.1 hypothetical protein [Agrobacterium tomkonis]OYR19474.1 hypothetical protein CEV32_4952 [Brucella rhizosphaerae]